MKEYKPFKDEKEFVDSYFYHNSKLDNSSREYNLSKSGMWLKFIKGDQIFQVLVMDKNGIFIIDRYIKWKELLKYHSFLDNSPCGKEVENARS